MIHSENLIHTIKETAAKAGKTGKYLLAMLPFLVQTLNAKDVNTMDKATFSPRRENTITQHPDELMGDDPTSVKDITLKKEYLESTKAFFVFMHEFLNGTTDDIDALNGYRKTMNKHIKIVHDITQNGKATAMFAVTSFFTKENNELVLKNISEINNEAITYGTEAKITSLMYNNSPTILFETDSKTYDYNIILNEDGEVSIVQKGNNHKSLKLNTTEDVLKFDTLLKEIFPSAYISYRDQMLQERKEKEDNHKK